MSPSPLLFSPFRIGKMELKNRIVMPPMATNYADAEGNVTERNIAYYAARAKGGVGYITIEHTGIVKEGRASVNMLLIDSDRKIAPFRRLVEAIHQAGGKVVIQINHAGRQTSASVTGAPIVAPSAIPCPVRKEMPRALSPEEIQQIVHGFAEAARRVKEAGADGVEIHMAHGYLLDQFLSPFSNQRNDEFGGDPKKRLRAPLEVLKAVRKIVGNDFPIICRVSADEFVQGGLKLEDSKPIARALEQNGADALHVSATVAASGYLNQPTYYSEEGAFAHLAEGIKSAVGVPVIAVGRIRTPETAARILEEKKADLVSMGRALIADPELPSKALQGRTEEIIPCISCNRCMLTIRKGAVQCAVNPETGREGEFHVVKAKRAKKVSVLGGGPAGMKAAEIAARRGHRVTLYEAGKELGGQFLLAAIPPRKQVLNDFTVYLSRRLAQLPVKVYLGKSFDPEVLAEEKPDVAIVATGATPVVPPLEGADKVEIFTVEEALLRPAQLGTKVLIIGGGGIGAEVADHLSESGKEVTLVEMKEAIALDLIYHLQHFLSERLKKKGVRILCSTKAVRFEEDGLWIEDPQGTRKITGFDSVVLALGSKSNDEAATMLKGRVQELHVIGDASRPREIMEALLEAEEVALKI